MATPLGYTPPTPTEDAARREVDDLVQALHDSGLLRALAGGARTYPELLGALMTTVDASALRSGIALAGSLSGPDPEASEELAGRIRRARRAVRSVLERKPEGLFALARRLRDPATRRGISAVLAALAALGDEGDERTS